MEPTNPVVKENAKNSMPLIAVVAFILLLVAYPVSILLNKSRNVERELTPEEISGLSVDIDLSKTNQQIQTYEAERTSIKDTLGVDRDLLIPARYNIKTFSQADFELLGRAPWALLTAVAANIEDVAVIRYVFNNQFVVSAFLSRPDIVALADDPVKAVYTAKDEAALNKFFNYANIKTALASPYVVDAIAKSRLMQGILNGKSAQYFIKNPNVAALLVQSSPTLSALKDNEAVASALKANPQTASLANAIFQ